jgi:hypothetical protein
MPDAGVLGGGGKKYDDDRENCFHSAVGGGVREFNSKIETDDKLGSLK